MHTSISFFFFNDTATTEIYTLSLHDALPIYPGENLSLRARAGIRQHLADEHLRPESDAVALNGAGRRLRPARRARGVRDRKSTRLNSSHLVISYAVFCLKKKKNIYGISLTIT